jgi:hypothetical protein
MHHFRCSSARQDPAGDADSVATLAGSCGEPNRPSNIARRAAIATARGRTMRRRSTVALARYARSHSGPRTSGRRPVAPPAARSRGTERDRRTPRLAIPGVVNAVARRSCPLIRMLSNVGRVMSSASARSIVSGRPVRRASERCRLRVVSQFEIDRDRKYIAESPARKHMPIIRTIAVTFTNFAAVE